MLQKYAANAYNTAFTTSAGVAQSVLRFTLCSISNTYAGFTVFYGFSRSTAGDYN